MWLECEWRHAWKRWSWEFEDFEKESVENWDLAIESSSWGFGHWVEELSFVGSLPAEMNWDLKHHEMGRTLGVGLA